MNKITINHLSEIRSMIDHIEYSKDLSIKISDLNYEATKKALIASSNFEEFEIELKKEFDQLVANDQSFMLELLTCVDGGVLFLYCNLSEYINACNDAKTEIENISHLAKECFQSMSIDVIEVQEHDEILEICNF